MVNLRGRRPALYHRRAVVCEERWFWRPLKQILQSFILIQQLVDFNPSSQAESKLQFALFQQ
jgi:hypothetical protein